VTPRELEVLFNEQMAEDAAAFRESPDFDKMLAADEEKLRTWADELAGPEDTWEDEDE